METLSLAWRNVWRNTRRTAATLSATTLAVFVMINYSGLVNGLLSGMSAKLLDVEMGDLQAFAPKYQDDPSLYTRIADAGAVVSRLEGAGFAASARLLGGGLAAAGDTSAGVSIVGLDVAHDAKVSKVNAAVKRGTWLDPADPAGVVIGWRLARTLNVDLGAELLLLSQAADGSMANDVYVVRGVLGLVGEGVDRGGVFMVEPAYRDLFVVPDGAHQIIIRHPAGMLLDVAAGEIRALLPDLDVQTWRELNPTLASYLETAQSAVLMFFFIIYIAIGIVILNAMLMAVFERIREFGVLKAIGMEPRTVFALVLAESGVIASLAIFIGAVLALPMLWYTSTTGLNMGTLGGTSIMGMSMEERWFSIVDARTFVTPIATFLVIVAAAVVYPALKAAAIRPVEAMRQS